MDTELELRYEELQEKFDDEDYPISKEEIKEQVNLFYAMRGLARIEFPDDMIFVSYCVDR